MFTPGSPFQPPTSTYPTYNPSQADVARQRAEVRRQAGQLHARHHPGRSVGAGRAPTSSPQLQTVGINANIGAQQVQQAELINDALAGKFQALLWRQFAAVDPDLNYVFWSPTEILGSLAIDMTRNNDPLVEDALQQGRRNATPSVRNQAYQKVSERFDADIPYIWLDRAVWCHRDAAERAELRLPDTPRRRQGARVQPGNDLADADLAQLTRHHADAPATRERSGFDCVGLADRATGRVRPRCARVTLRIGED